MTPEPFSVRIFLQDGHADGVKIIAKSKWPGRALVIPRTSLAAEVMRPELMMPGVYILVGPMLENNLQAISICSAERVCHALEDEERQRSFWSWVVVFASKDNGLTLAQVQYFESRLIRLALEGNRAHLDRLNCSTPPALNETERTEAESFLEHILGLCPLIGLTVFDELQTER